MTRPLTMANDGSEHQLLNQLPVGSVVGDFRITGVLGEGGFGVVYAAQDETLDRAVAIKEYLPSNIAGRTGSQSVIVRSPANAAAFEAGLKNFMREARMLARFSHPAMVEVYRVWEQNGTAYMAMRYIAGKTLREIAQSGAAFDEAAIRQVLLPVFDALSLLHQQNVIHRDVSPDNIMLREDGSPVLLDLGSARLVVGGMTQALTTVLKPGYAPIEQYVDDGTMTQGPWTDVYGLGATLYYLLVGSAPPQSIARMITDPLKSIEEKSRVFVPPQVYAATLKALSVRAENRFQTVDEFREALGWEQPHSQTVSTIHIAAPTPGRPPNIPITGQALPPRTTPAAPPRTSPATPPVVPIAPAVAPLPVDEDDNKTVVVPSIRATPPRVTTAPATRIAPSAPVGAATDEDLLATDILPPDPPAPPAPPATTPTTAPKRLGDVAGHIPATPPPSGSKAPILVGALALLLLGGGAWWWLTRSPAPTPSVATAAAPTEAGAASPPAPPPALTAPAAPSPAVAGPTVNPPAAAPAPAAAPPTTSPSPTPPKADDDAKARAEAQAKREAEAKAKKEREDAAREEARRKQEAEQRAREQAEAKAREEARLKQEAEQRAAAQRAEEERQRAAKKAAESSGGLTVDVAAAQRANAGASGASAVPTPAPAPAPARKSVNDLSSEGAAAFRRGDVAAARAAWNEIVQHPEATARSKAIAYNNLAISWCQAGDMAACERNYAAMLRADPRYGAEVSERETPPFNRAFERAQRAVAR